MWNFLLWNDVICNLPKKGGTNFRDENFKDAFNISATTPEAQEFYIVLS